MARTHTGLFAVLAAISSSAAVFISSPQSNHLVNVLVVVSDKKLGIDDNNDYFADVVRASDYYPFGWEMPGRKYVQSGGEYRFGFNGQEQDKDLVGGQGVVFKYRIHDPRIGKFLSVDPLAASYPWNSTYAFAENRVIDEIDLEGTEYMNTTGREPAPDVQSDGSYVDSDGSVVNGGTLDLGITVKPDSGSSASAPKVRFPEMKALSSFELENNRKQTEQLNLKQQRYEQLRSMGSFMSGEGGGLGYGLAHTMAEGVRQTPGVVVSEIAFAKAGQLYKLYKAKKVTQASKLSGKLIAGKKTPKDITISGRLSFMKGKNGKYSRGQGKMGRHLIGHLDFVEGKSYFNSIDDAQLSMRILLLLDTMELQGIGTICQ